MNAKQIAIAAAAAWLLLAAATLYRFHRAQLECKQQGGELWVTEYNELRCLPCCEE